MPFAINDFYQGLMSVGAIITGVSILVKYVVKGELGKFSGTTIKEITDALGKTAKETNTFGIVLQNISDRLARLELVSDKIAELEKDLLRHKIDAATRAEVERLHNRIDTWSKEL